MALHYDALDQELLEAHKRFVGGPIPFGLDMRNIVDILHYQAQKVVIQELRALRTALGGDTPSRLTVPGGVPVLGLPPVPVDDLDGPTTGAASPSITSSAGLPPGVKVPDRSAPAAVKARLRS